MCKVCKALLKNVPDTSTDIQFSVAKGIDLCLDHLVLAESGLEDFCKTSPKRLASYGYTEEDILILKYIGKYGVEAYAKTLQKASILTTSHYTSLKERVHYLIDECMEESEEVETSVDLSNPRKIKKYLDDYIVGQESAKVMLSIAIHDHYNRINGISGNTLNKKSNVLIIGPSGSGKTYLSEVTSRLLDVPFVTVSATSLTASGYVGASVEDILKSLILAAGSVEKAEKGIIYIDEVDKLAGYNVSGRDVGGVDVQRELLPVIQGCKMNVNISKNPQAPAQVTIDTTNILFICSGAFIEMKDRCKIEQKNKIGFGDNIPTERKLHLKTDTPPISEFTEYGMDLQFIARFPCIAKVDKLTAKEVEAIISKPKDCILNEYKAKFKNDGVELRFSKTAISMIANYTIEEGTNARGIRRIFETILSPYRFNIEDYKGKEIVIGKKEVSAFFQ